MIYLSGHLDRVLSVPGGQFGAFVLLSAVCFSVGFEIGRYTFRFPHFWLIFVSFLSSGVFHLANQRYFELQGVNFLFLGAVYFFFSELGLLAARRVDWR